MVKERFIRYLQFEKRFSAHTITSYSKDIDQFEDFLKGDGSAPVSITEANHSLIRSWVVELMNEDKAATSINRKVSVLRKLYKFMLREEIVKANPMVQVKVPKIPKRLPVVVEDAKLSQMLDTTDVFEDNFEGLRDRMVMELLFGTGMRLAEITGLKDSDVDIYNQQIRVLGKRNKERLIPLHTMLLNLMKIYFQAKTSQNFDNNSGLLIVTKEGKNAYPKLIYRIVQKYLSLISTQQKRSPHILRHTFATSMLNKGADLNAIKELLGHASLAATQVYTHNSAERLKSIYKQAHPKA